MASALSGTVAVVTGASSGIGEATAGALAAHGAVVALLSRRRDRLQDVAEAIAARGDQQAHVYPVDVTDAAAVADAFATVRQELGPIGVLVNAAGYGHWEAAEVADREEWHRMIAVNVTGLFDVTQLAIPHLIEAARGPRGVADVVTISSVAGRKVPGPAGNVYGATKHAAIAFSEALRQELAPKQVRVGLVEPGVTFTELTTRGDNNAPDATAASVGQVLAPEDVADAITYMVTRPAGVAINEVLMRASAQVV